MQESLLERLSRSVRYKINWDVAGIVYLLLYKIFANCLVMVLIYSVAAVLAQHVPLPVHGWQWLNNRDNLEGVYYVALLYLYLELPEKK